MPDVGDTRPLDVPSMRARDVRDNKGAREALTAAGLVPPERHAPHKRYDKPTPGKSATGPFVGWDGEGVTVRGRHLYTLLANSEGDTLYNERGLRTVQVLDWLCDIAANHPTANHVMFGGSYDANMILEGLGFYQASRLAETGILYVHKFRVEYRPRKFLRITRYLPGARPQKESQTGSVTVWDTIGFFQTSFVKALRGWFPEREDIIEAIARMKDRRSTFTPADIAEVKAYCVSECRLLVDLMTTMREHMAEVGCVPHRWDGAGAIASIMMQRNKVKVHRPAYTVTRDGKLTSDDSYPEGVNVAARYAYFGGRIELVRFGNHDGTCFAHDVVSAYPSAMADLPCLAHGKWVHAKGVARDTTDDFTVFRVRFDADRIDEPFYPLPWRSDKHMVYFPPSCEGWYWRPEYELLRDFYPNNHEVLENWTFQRTCDHTPFGFIRPVFEHRKRLKERKHHGATVLKLGLNSLYGKLAQQVGWQSDHATGTRRPPAYHCLEWAGWITSTTRARLFRLAMYDPASVVAFETDGLYSTSRHAARTGTALGDWEVTEYDGLTYVQSGVYWVCDHGEWKPKYRGMDPPRTDDPDAFTRDRVLTGWANGERALNIEQTRFRGMMTSTVSQERFCEWRQWVTDRRSVELAPNGKRTHSPNDCPRCLAGNVDVRSALHDTMATGGGSLSTPHPLAWITPGLKTLVYDEYYRAAMALDESDED